MPATLLHTGKAVTPAGLIQDAAILFREGIIEYAGPRRDISLPIGAQEIIDPALIVVPGFVDVHIHGAGGHDVMEGTPEALRTVVRTLALRGTTSFLATTVTADPAQICHSTEGIAKFIGGQKSAAGASAGAEILGVHFEGPFISPKRAGVHPPEWLRLPTKELFEKFMAAAGGYARMLTLAPELLGAGQCIEAASDAGVVVGIGHTDATYVQARGAMARGAMHAIHMFNAMRPFSHRDSGVIGAVLGTKGVTAELIADGIHVDEGAMRTLLQAKGAGGVILISDGISATGMPDGNYKLGSFEVTVSGGVCRNAEGKLAGSTLTLDKALRNVVALDTPLVDAVRMLTLNPATLIGISNKKGALRAGADADIVLLTEGLQVSRVWTRGQLLN